MKIKLPSKVTRFGHKIIFEIRKKTPEITLVVGIAGVVTSAVLACKATTKLSNILEESREEIKKIHKAGNDKTFKTEKGYTDEDYKRDLIIAYTNRVVSIVKLYGPSVILGAASITSLVVSHKIVSARITNLAAAYAVLNDEFKRYRKNTTERFGERVDKELRFGGKPMTKTNENGKEEEVMIVDPNKPAGYSDYARYFDFLNPNWEGNEDYIFAFLKKTQDWCNFRLRIDGYLFLNDVYEALGFDKTREGQSVGWIYDKENEVGDNEVLFEINVVYPTMYEVLENEKSIVIDFNVDGPILYRIKNW